FCLFFFQAEDGIRDFHVTGVQTCALPISSRFLATGGGATSDLWLETIATLFDCEVARPLDASGVPYEVGAAEGAALLAWRGLGEIGRASCRERGELSVGAAGAVNKEGRER